MRSNSSGSVDVKLVNKQISSLNNSTTKNDALCRLSAASILCFIFILIEVTGGLLSSSLAILSDAAHLCADFASFIVAILAERIAKLPPDTSNTFGYHRAEALAALYSMSCLLGVSIYLAFEAVRRGYIFLTDSNSVAVDGKIMSITAGIGVIVNIGLAIILGGDHHHMIGHGHDHAHVDHDHHHAHHAHHALHDVDHDHHHANHGLHDVDHDHHHEHEQHDNSQEKAAKNCHAHSHEGHDHHHDDSGHDHHHAHKHNDDEEKDQFITNDVENGHHDSDHHEDHATTNGGTTTDENLNLRAAYLHVLTDLFQSICVLVSGVVIWFKPEWEILDPIVTILYCIFVIKMTYGMIMASISILINDVPSRVSWTEVYNEIDMIDGVSNLHDLHIWSISSDTYALSVHVDADDVDRALLQIKEVCKENGIGHTTIQVHPRK